MYQDKDDMNVPLVSIVLATYNVVSYIRETLDSVLAQTWTDWELEVTDDASTDGTYAILEEYAARDSRVHLERNEHNSGAGVSRNRSLLRCTGRYIAFIDADDAWLPEKLEKQLAFMEENHCAFCFTDFYYCDEHLLPRRIAGKPAFVSWRNLRIGNNVNIQGVVYDAGETGKFFFPEMRKRQDWVMLIELARRTGGGYCLQEPLWKLRKHPGSLSSRKMGLIRYNLEVYHRHLKYSMAKTMFVFVFRFIPFQIWKRFRQRDVRL